MKKNIVLFFILILFMSCQSVNLSELNDMNPITILSIGDRYRDSREYAKAIEYYRYVKENFSEDEFPLETLEADYNIALTSELRFGGKEKAKEYYNLVIQRTDSNSALPKSFKILAEKRIATMNNKQKSYATDNSDASGQESISIQ